MDNLNLVLLSGGYHHCTSAWMRNLTEKTVVTNCIFPLKEVPESQLVAMHLNKLKPVYCWEKGYAEKHPTDFQQIPELFENPHQSENQLLKLAEFSKICN